LMTQQANQVFKTLLQTPASNGKQVIVTNNPAYTTPNPLDALAEVTYEEAAALLKSNQLGVQKFFEEKDCADIGKILVEQGVSGHSLHMLSISNIEQDLGPLNLGQQLAMKHLLSKLRFVAKTQQRRDEIWSADEYYEVVESHPVEGCCLCPQWIKQLFAAPPQVQRVKLPAEKYGLTEAVLRIVRSGWVDGHSSQARHKTYTPNFGCGSLCGYSEDPDPQYRVQTDNIDLSCVEDVDSFAYSAQQKAVRPSCTDVCCGYEALTVMQPAEVVVTYVERGGDEEVTRKTLNLKVDPSTVEDVAQKIIAARDEAQSGDHGDFCFSGFASGFASPRSVHGLASPTAKSPRP